MNTNIDSPLTVVAQNLLKGAKVYRWRERIAQFKEVEVIELSYRQKTIATEIPFGLKRIDHILNSRLKAVKYLVKIMKILV